MLTAETGTKLPTAGLRIHPEYVLMVHFQFLRWLLSNVEAFEFYLDQEPSIRGAFLGPCLDLVAQRKADAYFVRIGKTLTIDERKLAIAQNVAFLTRLQKQYPKSTRRQIAREVMRKRYQEIRRQEPNAANRWLEAVLPYMGEPIKQVACLTHWGDEDVDRIAGGMLSASLHPIDRFFMQMRRRLLERQIGSASSRVQSMAWVQRLQPGSCTKDHGSVPRDLQLLRSWQGWQDACNARGLG